MFKVGDRVKFDGKYGVVSSVDNECLCPVTVEFSGRFKSFPREVFRYLKKVAMIPGDYIRCDKITSQAMLDKIRARVKVDGFRCIEGLGTWTYRQFNHERELLLVLDPDGDLLWYAADAFKYNSNIKYERDPAEIINDGSLNDEVTQVWRTSDGSVFDTIEEAQRNQVRLKLYSVIRPCVDKGLDVTPLIDELTQQFDITGKPV